MVSQQKQVKDGDGLFGASERLLSMIPSSCVQKDKECKETHQSLPVSNPPPTSRPRSYTTSQTVESVVSSKSYFQYLHEARKAVKSCMLACQSWTYHYDGQQPQTMREKTPSLNSNNSFILRHDNDVSTDSADSGASIPLSLKSHSSPRHTMNPVAHVRPNLSDDSILLSRLCGEGNLDSVGDSSGYQSFNLKISRDPSPSPNPQRNTETSEDYTEFWELMNKPSNDTHENLNVEQLLKELEKMDVPSTSSSKEDSGSVNFDLEDDETEVITESLFCKSEVISEELPAAPLINDVVQSPEPPNIGTFCLCIDFQNRKKISGIQFKE